jgi:hypothetical protein
MLPFFTHIFLPERSTFGDQPYGFPQVWASMQSKMNPFNGSAIRFYLYIRKPQVMETYGKILLIAMPIFLGLVLLEKFYGWYKGFDTVRNMDMISSLSSGVTNVTKDVIGLSITILGYSWLKRILRSIISKPHGSLILLLS